MGVGLNFTGNWGVDNRCCRLCSNSDRRNAKIFNIDVSLTGNDESFGCVLASEADYAESIFADTGGEAGKVAIATY